MSHLRSPEEFSIHFWTPIAVPCGIEAWLPDDAPALYSDGRGHAFYELYARLRLAGLAVTIGRRVAAGTNTVVVFAKDLSMRDSLSFVISAGHVPSLLIESDWSPSFKIPIRAAVVVRSSAELASGATDVSLPLLPQRGLIPRAEGRRGAASTVGYKGDSLQAPQFLSSPSFAAKLHGLGLRFNEADLGFGKDSWHDFSSTDIVVCMRDPALPTAHKPPTKLINAWAAHCIPLVGPEPAYLALVTDHKDGLVVKDEESVLHALRELLASPTLLQELETGVAGKAHEFSRDRILQGWVEALALASASRRRPRLLAIWPALLHWTQAQVANLYRRSMRKVRSRPQ